MERNSRDSSLEYHTNDTTGTNYFNFSTIHICFPALNQFYYIDNAHLEYSSVYHMFFTALSEKGRDLNLNFENLDEIFELLKVELEDISYVNRGQVEYLASLGYEFVFFNETSQLLQMDRIIVEYFARRKILFDFKRRYITRANFLDEIKKNKPKDYIVLDYSCESLKHFEGCWRILLTTYVLSHMDKNIHSEIYKVINKNIQIIRENQRKDSDRDREMDSQDTSKESRESSKENNQEIITFSTNNFYQLSYYYNEMEKINLMSENDDAELSEFNSILIKTNPVIVYLLVRSLRRRQEFKKQRFYISNEKILYTSHIGGNNLITNHLFKKCDALLSKAVEVKDLELYEEMFQNITAECEESDLQNHIWMANYIPTLKHFVEKDLMGEYLTKFANSEEINNATKIFGCNSKLLYPQSITLNIVQVLDRDNFRNILKTKNIKFPLIVKYKGKSNYFKHLCTFVFEEASIENFLDYLSSIEVDDKHLTNLVIQRFINHGGRVLKFYHINRESFLDFRSSLPDINKEFQKNFEKGFWTFKTSELERGKFYQMLMPYNSHSQIESFITENNSCKLEFAYKIVNIFEQYSKFSLFGLDLLYAHEEDAFYIIDCNSLPGYKIRNVHIPEKFRNHFSSYFTDSQIVEK